MILHMRVLRQSPQILSVAVAPTAQPGRSRRKTGSRRAPAKRQESQDSEGEDRADSEYTDEDSQSDQATPKRERVRIKDLSEGNRTGGAGGPEDEELKKWASRGWPAFHTHDADAALEKLDADRRIDHTHLGAFLQIMGIPREMAAYYRVRAVMPHASFTPVHLGARSLARLVGIVPPYASFAHPRLCRASGTSARVSPAWDALRLADVVH